MGCLWEWLGHREGGVGSTQEEVSECTSLLIATESSRDVICEVPDVCNAV